MVFATVGVVKKNFWKKNSKKKTENIWLAKLSTLKVDPLLSPRFQGGGRGMNLHPNEYGTPYFLLFMNEI